MELDLVLTDSLYGVQNGLGAKVEARKPTEAVPAIFPEVLVVTRAAAVGWWEPQKQWEFGGRRQQNLLIGWMRGITERVKVTLKS